MSRHSPHAPHVASALGLGVSAAVQPTPGRGGAPHVVAAVRQGAGAVAAEAPPATAGPPRVGEPPRLAMPPTVARNAANAGGGSPRVNEPPRLAGPPTVARKAANAGGGSPRVNEVPRFAGPPTVAMKAAAAGGYAPHVRAALEVHRGSPGGAGAVAGSVHDYVEYPDRMGSVGSPPGPRRPVYTLHHDRGKSCTVRDVKTGQTKPVDSMFAGFVRMSPAGEVYVSPRQSVGAAGDSHPTIASQSHEWQRGKRSVVAGGEVGIIEGRIVGHNDRTGHFQTRKNRQQSGLPTDAFHPFTTSPKEWFKPPPAGTAAAGGSGRSGRPADAGDGTD